MKTFEQTLSDAIEISDNIRKNANGFIVCDSVIVAKPSVLIYNWWELPSALVETLGNPEHVRVMRDAEVLTEDMSLYESLPLIGYHPHEDVTVKDTMEVGGIFKDQRNVNGAVGGGLTIFDLTMVLDVENGKRELSLGYKSTLVVESGVVDGERYDVRITKLIPNHIALTEHGRCGPDCAIGDSLKASKKLRDSFCCSGCAGKALNLNPSESETEMKPEVKMKSVVLGDDNVVEVPADAAREIKAALKDSRKRAEAAEAERDKVQGKLDAHTTKFSDENIAKMVQEGVVERTAIISRATQLVDEKTAAKFGDMSNQAIIDLALEKNEKPTEGKSEDYKRGLFDDLPTKQTEDTTETTSAVFGDTADAGDAAKKANDAYEAARNKYRTGKEPASA